MSISIPKGTFDILPEDPDSKAVWRHSHLWSHVEGVIREVANLYGFREIRTPMFEKTELFQRGVGAGSDIVSKEMYTFEDKGKRSMTLRPEGTAAVMRAIIEKKLYSQNSINKLFYIGPMFRYERPQAGRYRQHQQFGVEAVGYSHPEQDAELLDMIHTLYKELGLVDLKFMINSVGDKESRDHFKLRLKEYLLPLLTELSEDSQRRFEINPLRILDSKNEKDQELLQGAPSILDCLNEASGEHFYSLLHLLDRLRIPYEVNKQLVRGLDYYDKTVFEISSQQLGAQNSIGGGGRYDGLIKKLGGPDLPAVGFATGIERVIQTLIAQEVDLPVAPCPTLFLIPLGDAAKEKCFEVLHQLRRERIHCEMDYSGKKLKQVMRYANAIRAKSVAIIGDNELAAKQIDLKDMLSGDTKTVTFEGLIDHIRNEKTVR